MQLRKLTSAALLIAIGALSAHLIYIPAGVSKCFPVQHAINVMGAVLLGPDYAVAIAFLISCLRNMFGTGILGGLLAWVIAASVLNSSAAAWFFIPPFLVSTVGGSIIAGLLVKSGLLSQLTSNKAGK